MTARHTPFLPDWSFRSHQWHPATHGAAAAREQRVLRQPMAVRRALPARQVEALKARWFALGSLATTGVLAVGYGLVQLMGMLP